MGNNKKKYLQYNTLLRWEFRIQPYLANSKFIFIKDVHVVTIDKKNCSYMHPIWDSMASPTAL